MRTLAIGLCLFWGDVLHSLADWLDEGDAARRRAELEREVP